MAVQFHHPEHLWAMAVLAIPILVHLFNFRRHKTVYFSNVRFLRTIKISTKNYSKLQRLLILLARLLLVVAVVLAFAQPYVPKDEHDAKVSSLVGIYIDNSFSMNAQAKNGRLLDQAVSQARAVVSAYSPQTNFVYLNNDEKSEHFRLLDKPRMLEELVRTEVSPAVLNMEKLKDNFLNISKDYSSEKKLYVISDFQKSTIEPNQLVGNEDSTKIVLLPVLSQAVNNISIDSCWFTNNTHSYGQDEVVNVRVCNFSSQAVSGVPVKLFVNDAVKSMAQATIEANSKEVVQLVFKNKSKSAVYCRAEVQDFPILFDNSLYFSYYIRPKIKVLLVSANEKADYISPVFSDESGFELVKTDGKQINYADFPKYNCIIIDGLKEISSGLAQELLQFAESGNTVVLIPAETVASETYSYFLSASGFGSVMGIDTTGQQLSYLAEEDPLYKGVFDEIRANSVMPTINFLYPTTQSRKRTPVLKSKDGTDLLSYCNVKSGRVFWIAAPYTKRNLDLISHPVMLPSIYNAALYSTVKGKSYYTISSDERLDVSGDFASDELLSIKNVKEGNIFIPQKRKNMLTNATELYIYDNIKSEGHYAVMQDDKLVLPASFNYSRKESDVRMRSVDDIAVAVNSDSRLSMFETSGNLLSEEIKQTYRGVELSRMLVIMALLFLVAELLLIRFWHIPLLKKRDAA